MRKGKKAPGAIVPKRLNASEAVIGFAGFLTSREEPVILSRFHSAPVAAELADAFIQCNQLPKIRENWHKRLVHPVGVDNLTNMEPKQQDMTQPPPVKAEDALERIISLLERVTHDKRNWVLAKLIQDQKGPSQPVGLGRHL